jgi:thiol-disulfide isomerase/thioredoxin
VVIAAALLLAATGATVPSVDAPGVHKLVAAERGRPVVVNFWATWCAPCVKEFPDLVALARDRQDVTVISISIDDESERAAVDAFVAKQKPSFRVFLKAPGKDEAFINGVDPKWSGSVPFTLIFDANGGKKAQIEGEQTRAELEKALGKVTPPKTVTGP